MADERRRLLERECLAMGHAWETLSEQSYGAGRFRRDLEASVVTYGLTECQRCGERSTYRVELHWEPRARIGDLVAFNDDGTLRVMDGMTGSVAVGRVIAVQRSAQGVAYQIGIGPLSDRTPEPTWEPPGGLE